MRVTLAIAVSFVAASAQAQSFSCRIGTEPACLDYGDKICSSQSKCVDENAVCFEQYQCGFDGFVCKSDLQACADAHDDLLSDYNALVNDFEKVRKAGLAVSEAMQDAESCVSIADNLDAARACFY